jgi:uncharacterized protein (PEP-CTERM system associated)
MTTRSSRADARLSSVLATLSALGFAAHAQTRTESVNVDTALTATAVRSTGVSSLGTVGTDMVTSASAAVSVHRTAGIVRADGSMQLTAVHDVRHQLKDRLVPTGNLLMQAQSAGSGLGLDVNAAAQQVKPGQINQRVNPVQAGGAYNNAQLRVSPYWARDLGSDLQVRARLSRALVQNWSSQDQPGLVLPQDTRNSDDTFSLTRRPAPVGYGVEWQNQRTVTRDAAAPTYGERNLRGLLTYAWPVQTLQVSGIVGQSHVNSGINRRDETFHGARLAWRPSPVSRLSANVEQHFWGQSSHLDLDYTADRLSLSVNQAREVTTLSLYQISAASSAAALNTGAAGTTGSTTVQAAALAPNATDGIIVRNALGGSAVYALTRRDTIRASAGFVRNHTLNVADAGGASQIGQEGRNHYLSLSVDHKVTRTTTWSSSLRWDRTWTISPVQPASLTRDFAWKTALNTALNPTTSATMGVQRDITHRTSLPETSDTQMFLGLNHRL